MNMSFYTASVGAQQQQARLDVHANNIANVNTYGFKAKVPSFTSLMYSDIVGAQSSELKRGSGSCQSAAATNFSSNGLASTGRIYDYAIEGDGFFALWNPQTEEYTYTRDGSFTKASLTTAEQIVAEDGSVTTGDATGKYYLSDGSGRFVLSDEGGLIEITDNEGKALNVGIFDFTNTDGMLSVGDNMFSPVAKNGQVRLGDGKLIQGYLEVSNADLATQLTKVIEAQRSFSYALRMMTTSDELETTVNNLR